MLRPTIVCAAILTSSAFATLAGAEKTEVVITVEKTSKPAADAKPPFEGRRPSVDVALLLDTSNSMDGLINQAKTQLWTIVQQFAKAKKNGQTPVLRVALFEYGNNSLPAAEGYIRQVVPLSDDLDKLSEALFALSTNGGDEYCGQVIDQAITRLDWSKETNGYKAIFIAGNEPFTQGSVDYHQACKRAIENATVVNTIHCGTHQSGVQGSWADGAKLAEGDFFNIDQDRAVVHIKCPQDEIIIRLNTELNKTYLWYGAADERYRCATNQVAQDANAQVSGAAAARVVTKAGSAYYFRNSDLVDSLQVDAEILKKLKKEELPEALQKMTPAQCEKHVKQMAAKRADIQSQINTLAEKRDAYLAEKRAEAVDGPGQATLGDAVVSTIHKQLKDSGFEVATPGK